jgi:ABC-type transport system substrate-binding protein
MSELNYWTRRRVSRRSMLRGAAVGSAGLAGAALIGCGGGDDDDGGDATAAATAAGTTAAGTATAAATAAATEEAMSGPVRGGVRSAVSANVYDSVDGHQAVASPAVGVLNRAQSKILRFANPNTGELVGDLAESWELASPTEIILNIRDGVKWHDAGPGASHAAAKPGTDLTTEEIVWNMERQKAGLYADGETEGSFGRKAFFSKIDSIEASDRSIKLTLTAPDATFVQGLANEFNTISQPGLTEAIETEFSDISADKVLGTGPYILTEWRPGERISGVRNPAYYDPDRPLMDAFVWGQAFEDPTAYRIGWEQKQVDSFSDPDPSTTQAIQQANADSSRLKFSGVANTVAAYTNPLRAPFNDPRAIRAVDLALNRRQLIQQLHNGLGKVSGPVAWLQEGWALTQEQLDTTPGYRSDGSGREADVAEANKLWQAAGGADAGQIDWVVAETWASRSSWTITPELVAKIFNDAFGTGQFRGITKSYGEIIPSWFAKDFDAFFAWIPNIEIPDARADMVGAFGTGSPTNIWGVSDPANIDEPLERAIQSLDYDEAFEIVKGVQEFVLENGQFGRHIAYNYVAPTLYWNYVKPTGPNEDEGWNFLSNSLAAVDEWLDPNDPSFDGRKEPTPTPV